jgi:hypothetical protein
MDHPTGYQAQRAKSRLYTKRYITVAGSVHQVTVEIEGEEIPVSMLEHPYAEGPAEGAQGEFLQWIVPGRTEIRLLKELDLSSS